MNTHIFFKSSIKSVLATVGLSALLLAGSIQNSMAVPMGPTFPPPGGVTFGAAGAGVGKAGGTTFTFTGFNLAASSNLYWGAASANAVGMALDGLINNLGTFTGAARTEIVSLSLTGVGTASGTGTTEILTNSGLLVRNTHFNLTVRDLTTALVPLITTGSVGLGFAGVLLDVNTLTTNGFTALLEAFDTASGLPLDNYFTSQNTLGGSSQTSFQGGFFYDPLSVPEPGTLAILGLGLVGLAAARRRKAA